MDRKRILIVDDETNFTQMMKINLEETGAYEVQTESRAVRALATAKAFRPDLILMDIIMPDLSGDIAASQIETDPELKNTPIVFVTATFLSKPVSVKELIDCIEENTRSSAALSASKEETPTPFNPLSWLSKLWKRD
jgi:DNA-binding response OmpR family regulator